MSQLKGACFINTRWDINMFIKNEMKKWNDVWRSAHSISKNVCLTVKNIMKVSLCLIVVGGGELSWGLTALVGNAWLMAYHIYIFHGNGQAFNSVLQFCRTCVLYNTGSVKITSLITKVDLYSFKDNSVWISILSTTLKK